MMRMILVVLLSVPKGTRACPEEKSYSLYYNITQYFQGDKTCYNDNNNNNYVQLKSGREFFFLFITR